MLSSLVDAGERCAEFADAFLGLLDGSEELFTLDTDHGSALGANEVVVRLYPSDALAGLLSTFRARYPDLRLFEHVSIPVELSDQNTTSRPLQSGMSK